MRAYSELARSELINLRKRVIISLDRSIENLTEVIENSTQFFDNEEFSKAEGFYGRTINKAIEVGRSIPLDITPYEERYFQIIRKAEQKSKGYQKEIKQIRGKSRLKERGIFLLSEKEEQEIKEAPLIDIRRKNGQGNYQELFNVIKGIGIKININKRI